MVMVRERAIVAIVGERRETFGPTLPVATPRR
jgi:hypothetical protein